MQRRIDTMWVDFVVRVEARASNAAVSADTVICCEICPTSVTGEFRDTDVIVRNDVLVLEVVCEEVALAADPSHNAKSVL
jgi:hypothetical protein